MYMSLRGSLQLIEGRTTDMIEISDALLANLEKCTKISHKALNSITDAQENAKVLASVLLSQLIKAQVGFAKAVDEVPNKIFVDDWYCCKILITSPIQLEVEKVRLTHLPKKGTYYEKTIEESDFEKSKDYWQYIFLSPHTFPPGTHIEIANFDVKAEKKEDKQFVVEIYGKIMLRDITFPIGIYLGPYTIERDTAKRKLMRTIVKMAKAALQVKGIIEPFF